MKARYKIKFATAWVALSLASALVAQVERGECRGVPKYDPEAETVVGGRVGELEEVESPRGLLGVHFVLELDETTYEVCVGPASFLEDEGFVLTTGEEVTVVGAWWTSDEREPAKLIAREITVNDRVLELRDAQGAPRWAGDGRRGGKPPRRGRRPIDD